MRQLKINHQITVREDISLEKYLTEISRWTPLTPDEEFEMAKRIRKGDEEALNILTTANLRFVVSVAKQYQGKGLSLSDLINEGNLGLIKAAKKFDETRGFKFISYAVWWIRQSIMAALIENSRMIRLPINKVDAYKKITKVLTAFLQEHQREPSVSEISELTDMTERNVRNLLKISSKHVSVDAPVNSDDNSSAMIDLIQGEANGNPDINLMSQSLKDEIKEAMSILNDRESAVLSYYYGLNNGSPLSLEEIGAELHLTRERVRQIKERAIRRLRRASHSDQLKGYMGQ